MQGSRLKLIKKNFISSLKNLLIFLPLLLSNIQLSLLLFLDLFFGFIVFSAITQVVYITNNYTDRHIDKKNKLKKSQYVFNLKTVLTLNFLILIVLFSLFSLGFATNYLILYIFLFYAYNFFLKKKKYLDIILLISFYLTRVAYGAEISSVTLTYEFFAFFGAIFSFLAIGKRIIQINTNKLNISNSIISYTSKDINNLKHVMNLSFWFSLIIFAIYGLQNYFYLGQITVNNNYLMTNNIIIFFIEFVIISLNFYRLKIMFEKNQIKEDIFIYVVKDKILIISTIISLALIIIGRII